MKDELEVITVGAGGALYSTRGNQTGTCFVVRQEDRQVVLDMGHGTFTPSGKIPDLELADTDAVILSHFHLDHFGETLDFAHAIQKLSEKKYGSPRTLVVYGPKGIRQFIELGIALANPGFKTNLEFREGAGDYGAIRLVQVHHSPVESLAAVLRGPREVLYTGDINNDPRNTHILCEAAETPCLLITEATARNNSWHIDIRGAQALKLAGNWKWMEVGHTRVQHIATVRRVCAQSGGKIARAIAGRRFTIR